MPICSRRTLSRSLLSVRVLGRSNQLSSPGATARVACNRELVSTATLSPEQVAKPQPLTLLHKVSSLLPRILPNAGCPTHSLELWNQLLDHAYDVLSAPASYSQAKIVVFGVDQFSGAHDLITTLLDDTISYDAKHSELLHNRPRDSTLIIENDHTAKLDDGNLTISSQWLRQFPIQVQVVEIPPDNVRDHLKTLLAADFPVAVVNPVTTPLSSLLDTHKTFLDHPNAILIVTGVRTPQADAFVQSLLVNKLNPLSTPPTILYIDPSRALSSLQAFKADPSSLKNIEMYQHGILISGIYGLQKVIRSRIDEMQKSSESESAFALQRYTAASILQRSLKTSRIAISNAKNEVDSISSEISVLRSRIAELRVRLHGEILGVFDEQDPASQDDVAKALEKTKRDLKLVMDSLKWWKLLWRVDEIGEIVGTAVDKSWCKDLERWLVFHTGRLSDLQQELSSVTTTVLSTSPSYFSSRILTNTICQLKSSPAYALTPTSLTTPLHTRKSQLAAYPTTRLHVKAQQIVIGVSGSVLGGLGISWSGWVGFTEPLVGLGAETTIGAGMLGALLGLRWAVGSWEKAKRCWWGDLDRIGEGLSRDLQINLDKHISENVVIVPEVACEGLESMTRTRKEQIAELEDQVNTLAEEARLIN